MNNLLESARPVDVLLVEDNQDDVTLTREGFKEAKLAVNLHHVDNGEKCMSFLRKQGQYSDAPTPDLILLDLNMPIMDGREVLAAIVKDSKLKHLPVMILTTSLSDQDVLEMYQMRCSAYASKPVDFNEFVRTIQGIADFWFSVVVLPING